MKWCKAKEGANALPENAMEQVLTRVQFSNMSLEFYTSQVETEPLIRDNLSCLRVIARASIERCVEGQSTSKKKRKLFYDIEDFEKGMRVKIIDDVLTLERLCKEGNDKWKAMNDENDLFDGEDQYGWNEWKRQIAGQWYEVSSISKNPPTLILGTSNWFVPVEAALKELPNLFRWEIRNTRAGRRLCWFRQRRVSFANSQRCCPI